MPEDLTLSILRVYGDDRSWLVGLRLLCLFSRFKFWKVFVCLWEFLSLCVLFCWGLFLTAAKYSLQPCRVINQLDTVVCQINMEMFSYSSCHVLPSQPKPHLVN